MFNSKGSLGLHRNQFWTVKNRPELAKKPSITTYGRFFMDAFKLSTARCRECNSWTVCSKPSRNIDGLLQNRLTSIIDGLWPKPSMIMDGFGLQTVHDPGRFGVQTVHDPGRFGPNRP
jgi:hypothetical protein